MALPDYEGWACFVAVADGGSFTAAAAALGLSKASVSKAVTRLEASLGITLLHRSSRVVAVSTAGAGLLDEARAMVAAATAATEAARGDRVDLAGPIRLAAPMSFGIKVLGPPHLSFTDRGVTFATNRDLGLCIRFHEPVPAIAPFGLLRHPGATVTVADPLALGRDLDRVRGDGAG